MQFIQEKNENWKNEASPSKKEVRLKYKTRIIKENEIVVVKYEQVNLLSCFSISRIINKLSNCSENPSWMSLTKRLQITWVSSCIILHQKSTLLRSTRHGCIFHWQMRMVSIALWKLVIRVLDVFIGSRIFFLHIYFCTASKLLKMNLGYGRPFLIVRHVYNRCRNLLKN